MESLEEVIRRFNPNRVETAIELLQARDPGFVGILTETNSIVDPESESYKGLAAWDLFQALIANRNVVLYAEAVKADPLDPDFEEDGQPDELVDAEFNPEPQDGDMITGPDGGEFQFMKAAAFWKWAWLNVKEVQGVIKQATSNTHKKTTTQIEARDFAFLQAVSLTHDYLTTVKPIPAEISDYQKECIRTLAFNANLILESAS